ncbi:MAG: ABC transporter permease [Synergistaceae bacterium]|nr:ABC transporter permease [Synergistaceae bacterium]
MNYISEGFFQAIRLIVFMDEQTWSAVITTIRLTTLSMFFSLGIGIPLGFMLGYFDFPGRRGLRTIVDTMLALPTVVVGLLVYSFISNRGPLGQWRLLFTVQGMAIGQTILALPIVIALSASAVESLEERLRLTLRTLGASGVRMAVTCLYECRFALLVAAVTAYGRIVAEVGVSMMLGGNIKWHTRTITTAITLETGKGDFALGIALGLLLLLMSFALNAGLSCLKRREA